MLLPECILIDQTVSNGPLFIERIKRDIDAHLIPVVWVSRDFRRSLLGADAGANISLVLSEYDGIETEIEQVQKALNSLVKTVSYANTQYI